MPITKQTKATTIQISIRALLSSTMEPCGQTIISSIDSSHQEIIRWLEFVKELPQIKESGGGVSFILESNTPLPEGFQQDLKDQCERLIANSKIFFNISSIAAKHHAAEKNSIEISEEIYEEIDSKHYATSPRQSVTEHSLSNHTDDDKDSSTHAHPIANTTQNNDFPPPPPNAADSSATASNLPFEQIQTQPASETVKNLGGSITYDQLLNLLKQEIQKAVAIIDKKIKNAKLPFSISTPFEDTKGRKKSILVLEEFIKDILTYPDQGNPDQPLTQELGMLVHTRLKDFYEDDGKMKGRRKTKTISMLFSEIKLMFQNITYANTAVSDDNGSPFPPPPPPLLEQDLLSLELTQFNDSELPLPPPPPPSPILLEDQQQLELNAAQPDLSADSHKAHMAVLGAKLRERQLSLGNETQSNSNSQPAPPPLPPKPVFSVGDLAPPNSGNTKPPLPPKPPLVVDDLTSSESTHAQCASDLTADKTVTFLEEIQQRKQQGLRSIKHSHPLQGPAPLDLNSPDSQKTTEHAANRHKRWQTY
ncbi:hypothetical protein AVM71_05445 [Piscirickettsia salmonis]|nr:hypothetical protein AVM71_05445 [Piscirickettsia salmonis]